MESTGYYTILGWTVTLVGGGIAYYYYNQPDGRQRGFQGRAVRNALPRAAAAPASNEDNARRRRREERAKAGPPPNRASNAVTLPQSNGTAKASVEDKEEKEDLAWARELQQKKQGTKLAAPTRAATRQKTVKQSGANSRAAELSTGSSTGGEADDDDDSPVASPALNGVKSDKTPSGKDVTDMLEPVVPGPAVLKLTEPTNPKKDKPKQQSRAAVEQETKKQRQNRKKVEEKKAQRDADERERRRLQEQQRRTAREARGEPAKNGLGISAAPANNAWKASNHGAATPVPAANGQLLDTFTNDTTSNESTAPTSVSSSPVQQGKKTWWNGAIPSEEEQQRILQEQDESSWSTVPAKTKKRGKNLDGAVQPVEVAL